MHAQAMISAHPESRGDVNVALLRCIEACFDCAQACTSCADACLDEELVPRLRQCIRLNLDCADICTAAGAIVSRRTGSNEEVMRRMLETCAEACRLSADECVRHAQRHEHCGVCADVCRVCEAACHVAAGTVAVAA